MLARSTILGLALLGVLVPAGLHGCTGTAEKPEEGGDVGIASTYEIQPIVVGQAGFAYVGGGETVVHLFLRGTDTKPPGSSASLQKISLYGAPGKKGGEELGVATALLHEMNGPAKPKRDWELKPIDLPRDKLTMKLGDLTPPPRLDDFSLLLRFSYKTSSGDRQIDRAVLFSSWSEPARTLDLSVASPTLGDQITSLTGKGAFYGSDGVAMYDFDVRFDGNATKIEAYAAKAGASPWPASYHLVYSKTFPSAISGEHKVSGADGRYNPAYDEYWFRVEVTEEGFPNPFWKEGKFTDIIANQGVMLPLGS